MIAVLAPAGRYAEALAELPLRTRAGEREAGAIVVVPGDEGWVEVGLSAAAAGAIALVIADPSFGTSADLRRIAEIAGIPVIVERPLLRPDVAADAVAARSGFGDAISPRILVADAGASIAGLPAVARDAIGWLRMLAGEELLVVASDAGLALLETRLGTAATLTVVANERASAGRIRIQVLGEVLTEVELEGMAARVVSASATGRLITPTRFESSERLAIRRAIEATEGGKQPDDLGGLLADTELVERIMHARPRARTT